MLLVLGRGEMVVFTAVNAVLLHNSAVDTWTEYSVVITVQRIIAFPPAVTEVHQSAMDTWTECIVFSK